MNNTQLNLARAWRSKNFDQIVGQELSVRVLKNSLYLNHFFPVYLFAGQRGCGKTTTARVFAAALNCQQLENFQGDPKSQAVPCLSCNSCVAMAQGRHPDFIEIDAASHTGVDNVRQIIEASTLLPLMGNKKIYLIDEAHMLSKSAFNAFLKILEEPPPSVLFILATTDPQKVIETVRSRCFQLFFNAVAHDQLRAHLMYVCEHEKISYDQEGLAVIANESDGSVRDALNMLEQIRFAAGGITKKAVLEVLGHLDDQRLLELFMLVYQARLEQLIPFLHAVSLPSFAPEALWYKMQQMIRSALWLAYGVHDKSEFASLLENRINLGSVKRLMIMLDLFCAHEAIFLKTTKKYQLLEAVLLRSCFPSAGTNEYNPISSVDNGELKKELVLPTKAQSESSLQAIAAEQANYDQAGEGFEQWGSFLHNLESMNDQLLSSVFKQARFVSFDKETSCVVAEFAQRFIFFKELVDEAESSWLALLKKAFGASATLVRVFAKDDDLVQKNQSIQTERADNVPAPQTGVTHAARVRFVAPVALDISDHDKWKTTHTLLKYFGGTVKEIGQESDE